MEVEGESEGESELGKASGSRCQEGSTWQEEEVSRVCTIGSGSRSDPSREAEEVHADSRWPSGDGYGQMGFGSFCFYRETFVKILSSSPWPLFSTQLLMTIH